jgi:acyl dehydratase
MTESPRYFEDVAVGDKLGPRVYGPLTTSHIVRFSTSLETFYPLHHDAHWVQERGMPAILVAGPFKHALLTALVADWAGPEAFVRETDCTHRAIDYPGYTLTVTGRVTRAWVEEGLGQAECAVELRNGEGAVTCTGRVVVALPRRGHGHVLKVFEAPAELYSWAFDDDDVTTVPGR